MAKRIKIDITKEEYNKYKSLIRRVNKKATSLIEEFTGKTMVGVRGVKTQKDDFLFLDFIIPEKKGVGLSKFKDIESFNKYIANLQDFMDPHFVENMTKKYRDNFLIGIQNTYGFLPNDLINEINSLSIEQLQDLFTRNPLFNLDFVYANARRPRYLVNEIKKAVRYEKRHKKK